LVSGNDAAKETTMTTATLEQPMTEAADVNTIDTPAPVTAPVNPESVNKRTICLNLTIGRFGNSKSAAMGAVTVQADKSLLRMSKQLLDSPELTAIALHDSRTSSYLKSIAFPSLFKGGVYLLAVGMVETTVDFLKAAKAQREALVDLAVLAYPKRIAETSARLGVMHNPKDYPSAEKFRASFTFDWQLVGFETPTRLKAISAAIFQEEREKHETRLSLVADECRSALRAGLAEFVDGMVERLKPGPDGKKKRIVKKSLADFQAFLDTFSLRDVTDDGALGTIVAKARAAMQGTDADLLKSDDLVRAKILSDFTGLQADIEPLIENKPSRIIEFDDDGGE
jgi:hypothetical protein